MKELKLILKLDGKTYTFDLPEYEGEQPTLQEMEDNVKPTKLEHYARLADAFSAYFDLVKEARKF